MAATRNLMAEESPPRLFLSYSHKDGHLRERVVEMLTNLKWIGLIELWYDREILPGKDWAKAQRSRCWVENGLPMPPFASTTPLKPGRSSAAPRSTPAQMNSRSPCPSPPSPPNPSGPCHAGSSPARVTRSVAVIIAGVGSPAYR